MVPSSRRASFQETCCISPVQSSLCSPCWKCHSSWQVAVSYLDLRSSSCVLLGCATWGNRKHLPTAPLSGFLTQPSRQEPTLFRPQEYHILVLLCCDVKLFVVLVLFSSVPDLCCDIVELCLSESQDVGSREASPVLLASQTSCSNHVYIWINCDEGELKIRWKSILIGFDLRWQVLLLCTSWRIAWPVFMWVCITWVSHETSSRTRVFNFEA